MNPIKDEWRDDKAGVRLILGDCLEVLPTLAGVDAAVIDPPYGIGYQHSGGGGGRHKRRCVEAITGDRVQFDPGPWLGYPIVAMFGADHYAQRLPDCGSWIAWDKSLGIGPADDFADGEFVWASVPRIKRNVLRVLWKGICSAKQNEDGKYKGGAVRRHPSQKPIDLLVGLMDACKIPAGATVLDGYSGSGSLAIACIRTGRQFVGIEIERRHWAGSVDRVRAELARCPLIEAARPRQLELLDAAESVSVDCPG